MRGPSLLQSVSRPSRIDHHLQGPPCATRQARQPPPAVATPGRSDLAASVLPLRGGRTSDSPARARHSCPRGRTGALPAAGSRAGPRNPQGRPEVAGPSAVPAEPAHRLHPGPPSAPLGQCAHPRWCRRGREAGR
ncbi:hypothetical protein NDU88_002997 [Pleurodeles waltl]|uniref:Uncharacterized protein n=1 Tax=Pleurodeles waltl TaxID=8319 RepID=A0AAV7M277_PLEWA|nr:hypothetical protein NDU88_002997 [Pleurodeles waltl]